MRRLIKTWREARAKARQERMLASNDIMAYYERMIGKPFTK